jgi:hypothetical protein
MKNKILKMGFTLIEVMLSLFITAIIIAVLSIVFNTGLRSFRQGRDLIDITKKAQFVMTKISSELSGAIAFSNPNISLQGNLNSVFFVAPIDNSSNYELCEVGYSYDAAQKRIMRYLLTKNSGSFNLPDSVAYNTGIGGSNSTFCEGVTAFEFHYFDGTSWSSTWASANQLPQLIEIKIEIQGAYPKNSPTPSQKEEFVTRVFLPNSSNN